MCQSSVSQRQTFKWNPLLIFVFRSPCRWVRAVNEYLGVLHSSPYMHVRKKVQLVSVTLRFLRIDTKYNLLSKIWDMLNEFFFVPLNAIYVLFMLYDSVHFSFYVGSGTRPSFINGIFNRSGSLSKCLRRWNGGRGWQRANKKQHCRRPSNKQWNGTGYWTRWAAHRSQIWCCAQHW